MIMTGLTALTAASFFDGISEVPGPCLKLGLKTARSRVVVNLLLIQDAYNRDAATA